MFPAGGPWRDDEGVGSRALPVECKHGVVLDWGDFGPDPEDGSVGVEPCGECEAEGGFPCPCGAAPFSGVVWHCRCGQHIGAGRSGCWRCGRTADEGAVYAYSHHLGGGRKRGARRAPPVTPGNAKTRGVLPAAGCHPRRPGASGSLF